MKAITLDLSPNKTRTVEKDRDNLTNSIILNSKGDNSSVKIDKILYENNQVLIHISNFNDI